MEDQPLLRPGGKLLQTWHITYRVVPESSPHVVLESPVWSRFLHSLKENQDQDRSLYFIHTKKTGPDPTGLVQVGYNRFTNWSKPVYNWTQSSTGLVDCDRHLLLVLTTCTTIREKKQKKKRKQKIGRAHV